MTTALWKMASFNVNSVRSRLELLKAWFEHRGNDLDVLAMQELKAVEEQFPYDFFKPYGFRCYINPQKRYNGVAVCAKDEPDQVLIRFEDELLDAESRMIYARFGALHLINVYAPHGDLYGDKFRFKMQWYEALRAWLDKRFDPQTDRLILTGDFNVTFDDRDVYDPELLAGSIGTLPEERRQLHALTEWGLVDAFRHLHPDTVQYTWWDYQGAKIWKNQGMRIDFILITPPVIPYLKEVEVDMWARRKNKIKPSDHAPVVGIFERGLLEG